VKPPFFLQKLAKNGFLMGVKKKKRGS